jgi:hypothetical protein
LSILPFSLWVLSSHLLSSFLSTSTTCSERGLRRLVSTFFNPPS